MKCLGTLMANCVRMRVNAMEVIKKIVDVSEMMSLNLFTYIPNFVLD